MYVVKVGNMYVKSIGINDELYINEILLSNEVMRNFTPRLAKLIAKKCNGEVIEITEDTTNE